MKAIIVIFCALSSFLVSAEERTAIVQDDNDIFHHVELSNVKLEDDEIATVSDLTLYLQTRANPTNSEGILIRADQFNGTINTPLFDPTRMNVFTLHGWMGTYLSKTNTITRDGILLHEDANIFMVDYSRPAGQFYTLATLCVPIIGKYLGDFINKMMATYRIPASRIGLVGQSLGGQTIAATGDRMVGLANFCLALDAAGPLFYYNDTANCLDPTDCAYVQTIHGNGGLLGIKQAVGHADYFPNGGGMIQPGCGPDLAGSCAHYRAYYYWNESLITSGFRGVRCGSYDDFNNGLCDGNPVSYFGNYPLDYNARGSYYFNTSGTVPYALG